MTDTTLLNHVCLVSKDGVCLLDMQQVKDKAQQLGLYPLARLIEKDLSDQKYTNGKYSNLLRELGLQI